MLQIRDQYNQSLTPKTDISTNENRSRRLWKTHAMRTRARAHACQDHVIHDHDHDRSRYIYIDIDIDICYI